MNEDTYAGVTTRLERPAKTQLPLYHFVAFAREGNRVQRTRHCV